MPYTRLPYFYDVLPYAPAKEGWLHVAKWRYLEGVFRDVCRRFGYREIRTPILEQTELFARHIGEGTDIVSKEMFTFIDRGERSCTLKPEGTAPVVRACIENGLFAEHPLLKLYYVGQNFRYERGQKGRYRQHQQFGVEVFGASDAAIDAEVILLAMEFFRSVGVTEQTLHINSVGTPESRPQYLTALRDYVRPHLARMSEEGKQRFEVNALRMLDTKDPGDLHILANAPRLTDFLDPDSKEHFAKLQAYLTALEIPFVVDGSLVRGFDYYTRTAFEIKGKGLGSQDTLCGGGRYDLLVEECGGPATPAIGFGMGVERCLISLETLGIDLPILDERPLAFIVALGDAARASAVTLLNRLRASGIAADMDYQGRNFKKQMKRADDLGARYLLILGEDELARGVAAVKDQTTKTQREVAWDHIAAALLE